MRSFVLSSLLLFTGCGVQFTPETLINSLRVMAVHAEPPEVAPTETTRLEVLYSDPSRIGLPNTIIWVGCEPDPLDMNRSACNDASILIKPSLITEYPPGLTLLGFGPRAMYATKPNPFGMLAPEDPIRKNGSVAVVMSIVVGENVDVSAMGDELNAVFRRIENKETPAAIALTRVLVSEKTEGRNQNPTISNLTFDGENLPIGARLQVNAGQKVTLGVAVPESAREVYFEQQPSGPVEKREVVVGAWYSIGGRFSQERFDVSASDTTIFTAPGSPEFPEDPVPERRSGQLWLVVRDNRGAQAWEQFRYWVCDESLPSATVTGIQAPSSADDPIVVTGTNMNRALDVVIGGRALTNGTYSGARDAFVGYLSGLPPGTYPVQLRGQNCVNADTGLTYTVQ